MQFLDSLKNNELVVNFIKNDENTFVLSLRGKVSSTLTGSILSKDQTPYTEHLLKPSLPWERVVIDFRGLTYINSIGAGLIIALYRIVSQSSKHAILLFRNGGIVAETLESVGFFKIYQPKVVWDNYDDAVKS